MREKSGHTSVRACIWMSEYVIAVAALKEQKKRRDQNVARKDISSARECKRQMQAFT